MKKTHNKGIEKKHQALIDIKEFFCDNQYPEQKKNWIAMGKIYLISFFVDIGTKLSYIEYFSKNSCSFIEYLVSFCDILQENMFELYTFQISVTFLVISFLTMFSDNNILVLWENIINLKLIKPHGESFKDISSYCFGTLATSLFAILLSLNILFVISFVVNILGLTVITIKMIRIYFSKEDIRKKLAEEFEGYDNKTRQEKAKDIIDNARLNIQKLDREEVKASIELLLKYELYAEAYVILDYIPAELIDWISDIIKNYNDQMKNNDEIERIKKRLIKRLLKNHNYNSCQLKLFLSALYENFIEAYLINNIDSIVYESQKVMDFDYNGIGNEGRNYYQQEGCELPYWNTIVDYSLADCNKEWILALCDIVEDKYFEMFGRGIEPSETITPTIKCYNNDDPESLRTIIYYYEFLDELYKNIVFTEAEKKRIESVFSGRELKPYNKGGKIDYIDDDKIRQTEYTLGKDVEISLDNSMGAFERGKKLQAIYVEEGNENYKSKNGVLYTNFGENAILIKYPPMKEGTTYTVPENITAIFHGAFKYCENLEEVTMTEQTLRFQVFCDCERLKRVNFIESIEGRMRAVCEWTFAGCSSLEEAPISTTTERIHKFAFSRCTSLTKINHLDSVVKISMGAFYNCSGLHTVVLPKNEKFTTIDAYTFCGCASLKSVTIPENVKEIHDKAFLGCPRDMTILGTKGSYAQTFAEMHGYNFKEV